MPRILVVDDNPNLREAARLVLADLATVGAASLDDEVLTQLAREPAELLILGLSAPLEHPLRILREVLLTDPNVRILVLADRELLPAAQRIFNYRIEAILMQPIDTDELRRRVRDILAGHDRLPTLREALEQQSREASAPVQDLSLILPRTLHPFFARIAGSTVHVVIEGERGTGKTAIAHRLHKEGPWRDAPFERIDSWAVTEARLDAAIARLASNGSPREPVATLCIEEIGLLAPALHPVVRDIAEGTFPPGTAPWIARMTFRLITTTTEPLSDLVARGAVQREFRDALSVLSLRLPPLRERAGELEDIAATLMTDWARRAGRSAARFSEAALERLRTYRWPGNLRELRAVVGRALTLAERDEIPGEAVVFADAPPPLSALSPEPTGANVVSQTPGPPPSQAGSAPSAGQLPDTASAPAPRPRPMELVAQLLAHEVKNPLVAIKTFTQLLKDKFDDEEFRDRFYEIVSEDVDRIDSLVEAASAFSRLGDPHFGPVDLGEMVDRVLKEFERGFLGKRIVVLRESSGASRPARGDKEQLVFALRSIISKVIDVMPEGSDLQISATSAPATGEAALRLLTTLRFSGAEGLLAELPVLGGGAEAPPGSLEVALAKEIIARQGGMLRFQTANEDTTILTVDLPAD